MDRTQIPYWTIYYIGGPTPPRCEVKITFTIKSTGPTAYLTSLGMTQIKYRKIFLYSRIQFSLQQTRPCKQLIIVIAAYAERLCLWLLPGSDQVAVPQLMSLVMNSSLNWICMNPSGQTNEGDCALCFLCTLMQALTYCALLQWTTLKAEKS